MKNYFIFLTITLGILFKMVSAQVPQGIPYQSIIRNNTGAVVANQNVKLRFSIRDSIATGTIVYRETHSVTTTTQGLANVNIGMGTSVTGTFSSINWGSNNKFIQVEADITGGTNYIDLGTTQMMSVPYALFSGTAQTLKTSNTNSSGFTHYIGEKFGGGVIFHLWKDSTGAEHGLVVALTDQSTSQAWSNVASTAIGSGAQSSWDGLSNSNAIVAQSGHTSSAAKLCLDLVSGGYSDWYLPSIDELSLLWHNRFNINKSLSTIGGATVLPLNASNPSYWSSAENGISGAWGFFFSTAGAGTLAKNGTHYVRAVRAF